MLGPIDSKLFADAQCSQLGLVEKKVTGEFRMMHHLSYPTNQSVNDGIPRKGSFVRLEMPSVTSGTVELVRIVAKLI